MSAKETKNIAASVLAKLNTLNQRLRFKYAARVANWLITASTANARRTLRQHGKLSILIDNTVLAHGITHETAWISTRPQKWSSHLIQTGYAARIPVRAINDSSIEYQHIRYFPGIASLARGGLLSLKTSAELIDERFRQPGGRFSGYGYLDHNIFSDVNIESVDGYVGPTMVPSHLRSPSAAEQQRTRLQNKDDPDYAALVHLLGPKNSQDAWHLLTAEKHGLFCFLTMDFPLCRSVLSRRLSEPLKSMRTRVMTPLEFGQHFRLLPIHPLVLSYNSASFPVRADLFWPDGRRQRNRQRNR